MDIWSGVLILFAVSLQVLVTINIGGTSLRVGSSDLLLPVLGFMLLVKWKHEGTPRIAWRVRHFSIWLLVLTFWMGFALLNGRLNIGQWQTWAVVNKGIGWLVLLGYLLAGGWTAALLDTKQRDWFLWTAFLFGGAIFVVLFINHALGLPVYFPVLAAYEYYPRFTGFFANPNAYGIFMAAMAVLLIPYLAAKASPAPIPAHFAVAILISAAVLSLSRSAWLGLVLAFLAFGAFRVIGLRELLRPILIAAVLVSATVYGPQVVGKGVDLFESVTRLSFIDERTRPNRRTIQQNFGQAAIGDINPGVNERVTSTLAAFEAWRGAPIIGIGIGTYFHRFEDVPGYADTIHNSLLWLLTETGLIGAGLFLGFFLAVLLALWRDARAVGSGDPFLLGCCGMLVVFAGASIGTEILYQRYFWFLLGLGLALPRSRASHLRDSPDR